ncbi:hypothetical protein DSECCO2_495040 [anaerobic digester metagenome]
MSTMMNWEEDMRDTLLVHPISTNTFSLFGCICSKKVGLTAKVFERSMQESPENWIRWNEKEDGTTAKNYSID